jgi:plastocyanin
MERFRSLNYVWTLAVACIVAACSSGTTDPDPDPVIAAASGSGQSATVGEALGDPLVVRVTRSGAGVSGASVSWAVTGGGGSVSPTTSTTDASGNASTTWTLGPTAGANMVQASSAGATGSPVTFAATGVEDTAGPPMSASVSVIDYAFDPDEATVAVGGTVTWTWGGADQHNVTFSDASSPTQTAGSYMRTFSTAGTFPYQCTIHAGMDGTITVQ